MIIDTLAIIKILVSGALSGSVMAWLINYFYNKKYSDVVISNITRNNISATKNRNCLTSFNFSLVVIKSDVYNLSISSNNKSIKLDCVNIQRPYMRIGDLISIREIFEKDSKIYIRFNDEYNNVFKKTIRLSVCKYLNGKSHRENIRISRRHRLFFKSIINKFY